MSESKDSADPVVFGKRKREQTTMQFSEGDKEVLAWLMEYLGCSRAEAIRSSIRAFALHLQAISRK